MSIARHFLREFRPLIRMLEEPLGRPSAYYGLPSNSLFDDVFFHSPTLLRPAVDVTEKGNTYVLEAELPGVKKENVDVRIGSDGRSITIEGKVLTRRGGTEAETAGSAAADATESSVEASTPVTEEASSNQITSERAFSGRSAFTQTVWLPHSVDGSNVVAKLSDGILHITVPKAEEKGSMKIRVE